MDSRSPGQPWQSTTSRKSLPLFSSFPRHRLSLAVLAAVGLMVTGQATGAGSCSGPSSTIGSAVTQACTLGPDESLTVTQQGSISVPDDAAVVVQHTSAGANRLINSGTLRGEQGYGS